MGGLGLPGAFGVGAIQAGIRERIRERLAQQQQAFLNQLQLRGADRADEALRQQGSYQKAQLESLAEERAARAAQAGEAALTAKTSRMVPGMDLSVEDSASLPDYLKAAKPLDQPEAPTSLAEGPQGGAMPGTVASSPQIIGRRLVYTGTDKQQTEATQKAGMLRLIGSLPAGSRERQALEYEQSTGKNAPTGLFDPKPPATGDANYMLKGKPIVGLKTNGRIQYRGEDVTDQVTPYTPPTQAQAPGDRLVKVEHKDPATGRTVIEWLPQNQLRGQVFQKGVGSATETRLASAQAVNQTGDDIIAQASDPAVASRLGPAMGRYSNLQDFIGNPPPEFSELAGSIESYSLANMGVHGMRSAQGAEMIKRMLSQPHTPESLIAAVRGLNKFSQHFMENEGRNPNATGTTAPKKPTAEELLKKYR